MVIIAYTDTLRLCQTNKNMRFSAYCTGRGGAVREHCFGFFFLNHFFFPPETIFLNARPFAYTLVPSARMYTYVLLPFHAFLFRFFFFFSSNNAAIVCARRFIRVVRVKRSKQRVSSHTIDLYYYIVVLIHTCVPKARSA